MRVFVSVFVALALSGCGAGDASIHGLLGPKPENVWKVEQKADEITGQPVATAWIKTLNTTGSDWDLSSTMLQLMCFKGKPVVRINFPHRAGANRNSTVAYRFDQKPGREVSATFLQDHKPIVIDDKDEVEKFVDELASSSLLFLRVTSLFAGRTTAEFRLNGAPDAVAAAYTHCPVKPGKPNASRA